MEPSSPLKDSPPKSQADQVLRTLTSGRKRAVRGGCIQAHVCAIRNSNEVPIMMQRLKRADQFQGVASWSYAYRLGGASSSASGAPAENQEGFDDGEDEGAGEKVFGVLERFSLVGLVLVVSRWNDVGADCGLETLGTALYSAIVERCKDLIIGLQNAMLPEGDILSRQPKTQAQPEVQTFDFAALPTPMEPNPNLGVKYGPNHFLAGRMDRTQSLPQLLGGDAKQWVAHDGYLQNLLPEELQALRSLRKPHPDILRVLEAVALLKGAWTVGENSGNAAAQWGRCREMIQSSTFRTELLLLDSPRIPEKNIQYARQLLRGLNTENTQRLGSGVVALFEWAKYIVRSRENDTTASERPKSQLLPQFVKPADAVLRTSGAMMMSKSILCGGSKSAPGRSRSTTMLNSIPNRACTAGLILGRPQQYMKSSRGFA